MKAPFKAIGNNDLTQLATLNKKYNITEGPCQASGADAKGKD